MRVSVLNWLGFEFIELSAEAKAGPDAATQANELFARFEQTLAVRLHVEAATGSVAFA